jgi:hypothetical protein
MWRTTAPAEWATPVPLFSIPRVIVSVFVLTTVTSTISSSAVSGSMTTVNVSPAETVAPPSREEPDTTVAEVPDDVRPAVSVVC